MSFDDTLTKNKNFKILTVICCDYRIYSVKKLSKSVKFNRKRLIKHMPNMKKSLDNLSEDRFLKLSEKYESEQFELKAQIKHMKKVVAEEKNHELNADGFLRIVRKYSSIEELIPNILHEFINKIVVHHREEVFGEKI